MGDILMGKAPSLQTYSTVSDTQRGLLNSLLIPLLEGGQAPPGVKQFSGPYSPPTTPLESSALTGSSDLASLLNSPGFGSGGSVVPTTTNAFNNLLTAKTPTIDTGQAFTKGVVQPLTTNFLSNILPSINAQFGRSAGGGFSSDALKSRNEAGLQLDQTLAQTGSQFAYNTAQANQQAELQSRAQKAGVISEAPLVGGLESNLAGQKQSVLSQILNSGAVDWGQQETGVQNLMTAFQNFMQNRLGELGLISGTATTPTQSGASTGGSQGLLPMILAAIAGAVKSGGGGTSAGGGSASTFGSSV